MQLGRGYVNFVITHSLCIIAYANEARSWLFENKQPYSGRGAGDGE
jgi:hypothetical protein